MVNSPNIKGKIIEAVGRDKVGTNQRKKMVNYQSAVVEGWWMSEAKGQEGVLTFMLTSKSLTFTYLF